MRRSLVAGESKDIHVDVVASAIGSSSKQDQVNVKPGCLRVKTAAWGLNFLDVLLAKGVIDLPGVTLGGECVGIIEAVAADVLEAQAKGRDVGNGPFRVGQRVACLTVGGWGRRCDVPANC